MNLSDFLSEERIIPSLNASESWACLVEMVDHLIERGLMTEESKNCVLEELKEREDQVSTGIGRGVAIPHVYCEKIEKTVAVFAKSSEGVDFDSLDDSPVHYVILFLVPKDQQQQHLLTLAEVARLFKSAEMRNQLDVAESREELLAVLRGATASSAA